MAKVFYSEEIESVLECVGVGVGGWVDGWGEEHFIGLRLSKHKRVKCPQEVKLNSIKMTLHAEPLFTLLSCLHFPFSAGR